MPGAVNDHLRIVEGSALQSFMIRDYIETENILFENNIIDKTRTGKLLSTMEGNDKLIEWKNNTFIQYEGADFGCMFGYAKTAEFDE